MVYLQNIGWLLLGAVLVAILLSAPRVSPKLRREIQSLSLFQWYVLFVTAIILGSIWAIYLWGDL